MWCGYHIFFIYPLVDGDLGCCHLLAILNHAAMSGQVFVCTYAFISHEVVIPRSGIAGLDSNSVLNILKN